MKKQPKKTVDWQLPTDVWNSVKKHPKICCLKISYLKYICTHFLYLASQNFKTYKCNGDFFFLRTEWLKRNHGSISIILSLDFSGLFNIFSNYSIFHIIYSLFEDMTSSIFLIVNQIEWMTCPWYYIVDIQTLMFSLKV